MTRYPVAAYRQLFPEEHGKPRGDCSPYAPVEDADHFQPEPNFFEWWYFDTSFEDGSYLVAIFHSSPYNMADHKPTIDLRYYPPGRPSITAMGRVDRAMYEAAPDHCDVRIGHCSAVDQGECYRLSLSQGPLSAELAFWPTLPGWKAGTGHLFADPVSGHHFDWVVPLPRAHVEGVLTVNAQRRHVVGTGYHDHNWGTLYLPSAFRCWTWGRILAQDWTLIFGDVVGRGASLPNVTPLMLARGDAIVLATDRVRFDCEDLAPKPRTGRGHLHRLHLTTTEGPGIKLTLTASRAMEAVDFAAPHLFLARYPRVRRAAESAFYMAQGFPVARQIAAWLLGKGSYVRWEADYRLDLPDYGAVETGQALYEMMLL